MQSDWAEINKGRDVGRGGCKRGARARQRRKGSFLVISSVTLCNWLGQEFNPGLSDPRFFDAAFY